MNKAKYKVHRLKNKYELLFSLFILLLIITFVFIAYTEVFIAIYYSKKYSIYAFFGILLSIFPTALIHEYLHYLVYSERINFKFHTKINLKKMRINLSINKGLKKKKCLLMLVLPVLIVGFLPVFIGSVLSGISEIKIALLCYGFSGIMMSCNDLYYFIYLIFRMPSKSIFFQNRTGIYYIERKEN